MGQRNRRIKSPLATGKAGGRIAVPPAAMANRDDHPPAFSLRWIQPSHCFSDCSKDEQRMVAEAMFRRRTLSWTELRNIDKHGLGSEQIERNAIRPAIPPCVTEDAKLLAFRFAALAPMVGFKMDGVFYILWLDRKFDVYDHG